MVFLKILHVFGLMPKIFYGIIHTVYWLLRVQKLVCEPLILKKECACLDTNTHTHTHTYNRFRISRHLKINENCKNQLSPLHHHIWVTRASRMGQNPREMTPLSLYFPIVPFLIITSFNSFHRFPFSVRLHWIENFHLLYFINTIHALWDTELPVKEKPKEVKKQGSIFSFTAKTQTYLWVLHSKS